MEHVFTLLSLALPREPLQVAYRGIHTDDAVLKGTALEYLESTLPEEVRESLWPFLEETPRSKAGTAKDREQVMKELMDSHHSIQVNLEELRRRLKDPE
jgi:hypothetical protein